MSASLGSSVKRKGFFTPSSAFAPDSEVFEWVLTDDGDAVGLAVTKLGCGHVTTGVGVATCCDLGCSCGDETHFSGCVDVHAMLSVLKC